MNMERILSMLGLAHKAGRVEIGEEPVGSSARAKKARRKGTSWGGPLAARAAPWPP